MNNIEINPSNLNSKNNSNYNDEPDIIKQMTDTSRKKTAKKNHSLDRDLFDKLGENLKEQGRNRLKQNNLI